MRRAACACVLLLAAAPAPAADPPLVEKYLHSGELAQGERALQRALEARPADDQARFGLGVLRFVRAVERLGQSLHEHGVKSESADVPFLRIPVPANPDPTPITYPILRRIFEQFTEDLAKAETTLAGVKDEKVALPLRLAEVKLDLTGGGKPTTRLLDLLKKLMRVERFEFLKDNPAFLVRFDRGDVAWLRAYCHLLSAMLDAYLAIDGRFIFDLYGGDHFARPKGVPAEKPDLVSTVVAGLRVVEPARLHSFRTHMLAVCELNRETWKYVRAETDDDHEWLPNPRQTGVLRLPVTDEMIGGWLAAVGEFEAVLKGEKLVAGLWAHRAESGINLKALLDDPPARLDVVSLVASGVADAKYLGKLTDTNRFDDRVFARVSALFGDSLSVAYAAWFN